MAIEEKEVIEGVPATEGAGNPSKKELIVARLKEKYPDEAFEDDESIYGRIGEDYDAYENDISERNKADEGITKLFASDPRAAQFMMDWQRGEDPVIQLVTRYGDDFLEALQDPDRMEKLEKAREAYLTKQLKEKDLQEQAEANLSESLTNLDNVAERENHSKDETQAAFVKFMDIVDDAIVNKISEETWSMIFKAQNYDQDVAEADRVGEVRGRNAKINGNKLKRTVPEDVPPMLGGDALGVERPESNLGALDRYATNNDIWARGNMRRYHRE